MAPVAFDATIPFKGACGRGKWQESRLVVLPHFRGRGIGIALSEWVGEYHRSRGERMYSTTRNWQLGQVRDRSPRWRPTRWNGAARAVEHSHSVPGHSGVIRYCHEYVGLTTAEQPP
ncbi:hypothetical protein ASD06_09290 [Angustibacter sp. Root456]|nr:hypothetical protein ASD06_09290 [Angustibacter sp. Root456]